MVCIKCILIRMFEFRRKHYGIERCPCCKYWERRPWHKLCGACEAIEDGREMISNVS